MFLGCCLHNIPVPVFYNWWSWRKPEGQNVIWVKRNAFGSRVCDTSDVLSNESSRHLTSSHSCQWHIDSHRSVDDETGRWRGKIWLWLRNVQSGGFGHVVHRVMALEHFRWEKQWMRCWLCTLCFCVLSGFHRQIHTIHLQVWMQ